jgi:hypothetical protein
MTGRFEITESTQGLDRGDYDQERDSTYLAIPMRVTAPSADEAIARARATAEVVSATIDRLAGVEWITTNIEGAYALIANLVTAMGALDDHELALLLLVAPGIDDLRRMLEESPAAAGDG